MNLSLPFDLETDMHMFDFWDSAEDFKLNPQYQEKTLRSIPVFACSFHEDA
jgi:hypothetical protein